MTRGRRALLGAEAKERNIMRKPDILTTSEDYSRVRRKGTRLAMPKTIYASDSSSLKPGSGATEGVPD